MGKITSGRVIFGPDDAEPILGGNKCLIIGVLLLIQLIVPCEKATNHSFKMRIVINALSALAGGSVTYLNQLFKYLSVLYRINEYLVITTKKDERGLPVDYKNFCVLSFNIPRYILKKYRADVLYSPGSSCIYCKYRLNLSILSQHSDESNGSTV